MMYNSYFKEREKSWLFCTKLWDKCPGWHKILYLMWYADVGTGTTASPATAPANLCAAATCASATTAAGLCPAIATGLRTTSTGIRGSGGRSERSASPGSKYEPITTGGYIGIFLLMLLPLINLILLIIWPCGGCQKVNKANFARALLIMMIIGSVLSLLMFFAVRMLFGSEIDSLMEAGEIYSNNNNTKIRRKQIMAFCGKCGQQVNEGVRFCPACGSPMQIVAAEPNRQQTPPPVQPTDAGING